jgi:hypothetical protein
MMKFDLKEPSATFSIDLTCINLAPLVFSRRKAKSEENLGLSSSIFGDDTGAPRQVRIRTRSFDMRTVRQITHDNTCDPCF